MGSFIFLLFFFFFMKKISFLMFKLLLISIFMSLFAKVYISTWLGGLFFLIYVGAMLVLLFYIFSLSSKMKFYLNKTYYVMGAFFIIMNFYYFFKSNKILNESLNYDLFKDNIMSNYDGFFFFFSLMLFLALWVASKLQIFNKLALRVFF